MQRLHDADHGHESDVALLERARSEAAAFGEFYDRHSAAVLKYFAARTACSHTAADLTAETFAEALRTLHRYRPKRGVPRAWLFGIAANMLRRYLRTSATSVRARRRLGLPPVQLDHAEEIVDLVDMERLKHSLGAGLASLSPGVRAAVELRVVRGLAYSDVAMRLSCSEGAARVRVTRGLTALAEDRSLNTDWLRTTLALAEAPK